MSSISAEQFEAEMAKKRSEEDNVGVAAPGTMASGSKA